MRTVRSDILHVRVEANVYEAITKRATAEQRTVADMARVLLTFALAEMPHHTVPKINSAGEFEDRAVLGTGGQ